MFQPQPIQQTLESKLLQLYKCYGYCMQQELKNVFEGNYDLARTFKKDSAFYMQEIERLSNYIEERKQIVRLLEKIGERDCVRTFIR